jgi:hypothetical protein
MYMPYSSGVGLISLELNNDDTKRFRVTDALFTSSILINRSASGNVSCNRCPYKASVSSSSFSINLCATCSRSIVTPRWRAARARDRLRRVRCPLSDRRNNTLKFVVCAHQASRVNLSQLAIASRIQRRSCSGRPHALVCEPSRSLPQTKIKQNIPKNIPQVRLSVVFHRFLAASFAISVRRSGVIFAARPASSRRRARCWRRVRRPTAGKENFPPAKS